LTACVCRTASHATSRGVASAARAMTPPTGESSSLSSSSNEWREFRELVRRANESHQPYFNATCKVSLLERYLNAIRVALKASERETAAAQVATADTQARIMGKGASSSCYLIRCLSFLIFLSSCHQRWKSSWWPTSARRRRLTSRRFS
jgi:hypothetical protein